MRVILVFLPTLLVLGACAGPDAGPGPAASPSIEATRLDPARPLPSPLPDVVARVNGEAIPLHRILPLAKLELQAMPVAEQDKRLPEAVRRALKRYIDRELLFQEAIARDVAVDKQAIDWAYDQARAGVPDEEEWRSSLAKQGFDEKSFRTEIRVQHTVSALLEQEAVVPLLARLRKEARIETFL